MSSVIVRSNNAQLLWPGIAAVWGSKYDLYEATYSKIFTKVMRESGLATERLVGYSGFGNAQIKTEGAAYSYDTDGQSSVNEFTYFVRGLAFQVTEEELEDNQYREIAMRRTANLQHGLMNSIEQDHADVLINAFSSAVKYGDGQPLISQVHPTKSGPQANEISVAADFSEAGLEDVVQLIVQATDDRGLRIKLQPKMLIGETADMFNAERVLQSQLRSGSSTNDVNAIKSMGLFADGFLANPFFGNEATDQWFVKTDIPDEVGLQSFWRREPRIVKDNSFSTGNLKVRADARYVPVVGDWRAIYGSPGS